jgi:HAD superfamily hydrolase (TIGR01509 family)
MFDLSARILHSNPERPNSMSFRKGFIVSAIKCIIFDCDGVLIDSEVISARIMIEELAHENIEIDFAHFQKNFLGRGFAKVAANIRANSGKAISDEFETRYRGKLMNAFTQELQPMPGIFEVLDQLSLPYCVATSSSPTRVAHSLKLTGLQRYFGERVFTASQVTNGKPAPDLFLFAAAQMGVPPPNCLVIEDSETGLQAAINAQMTVWHYTGGSHLKAEPYPIQNQVSQIPTFDNWALFPDMFAQLISKQADVRKN